MAWRPIVTVEVSRAWVHDRRGRLGALGRSDDVAVPPVVGIADRTVDGAAHLFHDDRAAHPVFCAFARRVK
eukprot:3381596-Prymnesium_polylepis.2